ncbi:MAG: Co2+/Mg2+ efflux protein ApaG [Gammaproteobacteria bacterium]|nr:Co2+/Mg2+ efflux protein ApaG [Gammaproteobacteria bacterium]MAY02857.1 Co2+/Mg2+ efflux protein ApaG [Gammaproteobacteria bacterium]
MKQETSENSGIEISVQTQYLEGQSDLLNNAYAFSYTITIQNNRQDSVQLLRRHWVITDQNNKVEEVKGKGVVGQQPVIKPGDKFRYSSGTILNSNIGDMKGSYTMQAENGETFEAEIPAFVLATPNMLH